MALAFHLEQRIQASADRVFAVLTDLERAGDWMPGFVRIEVLTPGPIRIGTTFRETRKMFGREAVEQFEVTDLDPPRLLGLTVDGTKGSSGKGTFRFRHLLVTEGSTTIVRLEGTIEGLGRVAEFFGRLFMGTMTKATAKDLEALRAYAEAG